MKYPMNFLAATTTTSGISTGWTSTAGAYASGMAIPPEFMGPGGGLSPEDLFNEALANCFVATFKVYAEKSKVAFASLDVTSRLVVDLDDQKRPVMKDFFLAATIKGPSHPERAIALAKKASESGFILNSVKTNCHFQFSCE